MFSYNTPVHVHLSQSTVSLLFVDPESRQDMQIQFFGFTLVL